MYFETECVMTLQGHPRSLILAPIESACDFLLVINSNLDLAPFQKYCRFSAENGTPPLFHPNVGGVSIGLDVGAPRNEDPKLITRIIFELNQLI